MSIGIREHRFAEVGFKDGKYEPLMLEVNGLIRSVEGTLKEDFVNGFRLRWEILRTAQDDGEGEYPTIVLSVSLIEARSLWEKFQFPFLVVVNKFRTCLQSPDGSRFMNPATSVPDVLTETLRGAIVNLASL